MFVNYIDWDLMQVAVLLFDDFETLDVFGPVEIFGRLKDIYSIGFYSLTGGSIGNSHGVSHHTLPLEELADGTDIFLIPGGYGTRKEVQNEELVQSIRNISGKCDFILSVCTGSALLARTGLLDNKAATSNKRAFEWVSTQGINVNWQRKARWTVDGKYYTSSGVSAGIDMTLGFLSDRHGYPFAKKVADELEYLWTEDKDQDPFYELYEN